ncbi:RHTO0S18e01706g1_1 [Rhodotorula toruloides]|uniref:RHTO0S18e01706g1_1 n=1 Tax=Rhodotorula toruloides TaxID=5286 RepID=A0A061BEV8_RHOTO|nr:RHTO0S18e01706g1_1 [Rhodotorula toruloides]
MELTLPKPDEELAAQLDKDAPAGRQIVRAVTGMLQTLLRLDRGTGLVISTMRLAELVRIKDLPAPEPLKKSAQMTAQLVATFRRQEYPEAFSRSKGKAHTDRLQIESLAEQIVAKMEELDRRVDSAREASEKAPEDERERYENSFRALHGDWEFMHRQVLHDFYTELKRRLGEERFEHIRRNIRQLPAGAGSLYLVRDVPKKHLDEV